MIDLGQRAVVADAAGQQEIDAVADALVHDARGEHAALDGLADAAGAADAVDRPQVVLVARLGQAPRGRGTRPGWCRTGPARCRGWPGRCRRRARRRSPCGSTLAENSPLPVWTMAGPAHQQRLAAGGAVVGPGPGRSRRMATPLGFSVETLLSMNANVCGPRDRSSGNTRTPACPTTIASPTRTSFIGTQRAARLPRRPGCRSPSPGPRPGSICPARRISVRWLVVL